MTQSLLFEGVTGFATMHPVFTLAPIIAAVIVLRLALKRHHHPRPEPAPARARAHR